MRDKDESQARLVWKSAKQVAEGFEATCRGTDRNNGEGYICVYSGICEEKLWLLVVVFATRLVILATRFFFGRTGHNMQPGLCHFDEQGGSGPSILAQSDGTRSTDRCLVAFSERQEG